MRSRGPAQKRTCAHWHRCLDAAILERAVCQECRHTAGDINYMQLSRLVTLITLIISYINHICVRSVVTAGDINVTAGDINHMQLSRLVTLITCSTVERTLS